jgi:tetratricopeptide (TPR) repeat protein
MDQAAQDLKKLEHAEKLFMSGKITESEPIFRSLTKSHHVGPRAGCDLGLLYVQTGKTSEAEALFKSIINAGHRLAEAYYGLGVIFDDSNPGYARAQYEFALSINPYHKGSRNRLNRLMAAPALHARPDYIIPKDESGRRDQVVQSDQKSDPSREGIAKNVRIRTEPRGSPARNIQIIEFTLQRGPQHGPLPVYMSGHRAKGTVKEGDRIILKGKLPKAGQTFESERIFNETAGGYVEMSGRGLGDLDIGKIIGGTIFIVGVLVVLFFIITSGGPPRR